MNRNLRTTAIAALASFGMAGCILPPGPGGYGMGGPHGGPGPEYGRGGDAGFAQGQRLPGQYMDGGHAVRDPGERGLRPAPEGYGWFDVNGQFVLAAIATGVIASVLIMGPHR